ncbi:FIBCD1 [Branchiostoma lanceolatum]|uniref:FIBCD1 protein n=1 Tax=Branchiostoma lanceolatum TaxID=7740 RepID=A0A8J9VG11_BRALA|nr:FIBCD1 [Branchiostoma lanceolatum]
MSISSLLVMTAVLQWSVQWSVVAEEGQIDQLTLSLCTVWKECVKNDHMAHAQLDTPSRAICLDFVELLEKHGMNCETPMDRGKPVDVTRTLVSLKPKQPPVSSPENEEKRNKLGYKPHHQDNRGEQLNANKRGRAQYYQDCSHIHTAGLKTDGVYSIKPVNASYPVNVYCDQTTDGGGWTVVQRRFNGSLEFYRFIDAYRDGFGNARGEYWLGLDTIHRLTAQNSCELYIELEDWAGNVKYARYSTFSVGPGDNYTLIIGGYSGTAGNGMDLNSGLNFTARGSDPEAILDISMAQFYGGGWWYFWLGSHSNLNGPYFRDTDGFKVNDGNGPGVLWSPFNDSVYYSLRKTKMMVRPM